MNTRNVYIIGSGVSGLVAAIELERAGYYPVILEAENKIGGRIKTDVIDGFKLDHGFQVLLTAYPEARFYLDFEELSLKIFQPGAVIFKPGDIFSVYDPLRNPLKVIPMVFSKVGTILDKVRIYKLTKVLKETRDEDIFSSPEMTTMEYLKRKGFSNKIIQNFFKPFFKGIFLENDLKTSSRMFEFVFKMFATGNAAIPENGMQEIPNQLFSKLRNTKIQYNTKVNHIESNRIHLESGDIITADDIIVATSPETIFNQLNIGPTGYHSVTNLYFTLEQSFVARPMIALVPDEQFLVNNFVFLTDVSKAYSEDGRALLSVSVVKDVSELDNLEKMVALELEALSGIRAEYFKHLKTYHIPKALPEIRSTRNWLPVQHTKVYDHVYLAGDHMLNGSINAAMISGRKAAEALIGYYAV